MPTFSLLPEFTQAGNEIVAGDASARMRDRLLLGKLAESGRTKSLWLDASGEQVTAIFGKRGTGKSYTLGVMLEAMASGQGDTDIASLSTPRAVLMFDIMDIFWSSQIALSKDGPEQLQRQYDVMRRGGYQPRALNIDTWVPAGFERPEIDPPGLRHLRLQASDFEMDDWGALFGFDIYNEPRGMLLADVVNLVKTEGYENTDGTMIPAATNFTFSDVLDCLDSSAYIEKHYRDDTRRSVRQRLASYASLEMFKGTSTPLGELLQPWRASVLMLARLPDALKSVIVAVLLRRIMRARQDASFAQKRLDMDAALTSDDCTKLTAFVSSSIPRTTVMMDEAHVLAGKEERTVATEAFVRFAKEGRNIGLSLTLATQQPSAVDARILSQVETLIVHQLTARADTDTATTNMRSPMPQAIKIDGHAADLQALFLRLPQGVAVFSSGNAPHLARPCIVTIRPRVTAHGGYEA